MKTSLKTYLSDNIYQVSPEFPVGFYPCGIPGDFPAIPAHWHEEMEVTLVTEGSLHCVIGSYAEDIHKGDLVMIAPDTLHSAHGWDLKEAKLETIVFHLNLAGLNAGDSCSKRFIEPVRQGRLAFPPVVHPDDPCYEALLGCFHSLWECRADDLPYRELEFKYHILRFFRLLWQCADHQEPLPQLSLGHPHEAKLRLALSYMQEHYAEPITVGELAELCGFSEVHFMNVFKAVVGSTCIEYLIEYRLALAAIALRETDCSIMQAALGSGFQNISYFNRTFKKKYHCTPSAYRRMSE